MYLTFISGNYIILLIKHYFRHSEVIKIEKRRFIAELGRLLTFMYEEDRNTAISMYEDMFSETSDEEALMRLLVSPTKQAVVIARAYNAKERDLAIRSQLGRGDADVDSSDTPAFVKAIEDIAEKAGALGTHEYRTAWDKPIAEAEEKAENDSAAASEDIIDEPAVPHEDIADEPAGEEPEPVSAEPESPAPSEHDSEIDSVMASFSEPENAPEAPSEPQPEEKEAEEETFSLSFDEGPAVRAERSAEVPEVQDAAPQAVREATAARSASPEPTGEINIGLLILYILIAVPLTAACVLILIAPAVICLALSFVLVTVAVKTIATAFGGFAVFADIMVVLGGSLVIIALGILFLWLFIWFIGGAIVGIINASIRLGGKFCTTGGDR